MCKMVPDAPRGNKGVLQLSLVIKHATGVEKVFKKVSSMTAVEAARKLRQRQEMCKRNAANNLFIPVRHGRNLDQKRRKTSHELQRQRLLTEPAAHPDPAPAGKKCVLCHRIVDAIDDGSCWFHPDEMVQIDLALVEQCAPWRYPCCSGDFHSRGCSSREHVFVAKS